MEKSYNYYDKLIQTKGGCMDKRNRRALNNFMRDAGDAAKIAGSHVPGLRNALEGYEIAKTANNLSKSGPRAYRALKNEAYRSIQRKRINITRRFRKLI
jgi:hypothetical protein